MLVVVWRGCVKAGSQQLSSGDARVGAGREMGVQQRVGGWATLMGNGEQGTPCHCLGWVPVVLH